MSLTGISKLWEMTTKMRGQILAKGMASREKKLAQLKMKKRHLTIDPLEERNLLSLTIGSTEDILVNTEWQDIRGDVATAINASNDVVAAWTAADRLTDPVTGETLGEDMNIYARYLTDETQVVTIAVATPQIGKGASFELLYGSAAVQRLSFFSATPIGGNSGYIVYGDESVSSDGSVSYEYKDASTKRVAGTLTLSLDGNEFAFAYDSSLTPTVNAQNIQKAIRSLGAVYKEIEVTAYSETEFDITYYGGQFVGTVPSLKLVAQDYSSGFNPSALIETTGEPTTITNYSLLTGKQIGITVTSDAARMAAQIEKAFERNASDAYYAPVMRAWYYDEQLQCYVIGGRGTLESAYQADTEYPYYTTRVFPNVEVNVTALETEVQGGFTYFRFEITFTGNSGYVNHQELKVSSLYVGGTEMIEDGYVYVNGADAKMNGKNLVETIKESSPVFRVNAPEPAAYATDDDGNVIYDRNGDPVLTGTGKTDQYNPSVCFDDTGNFVVVWQSDMEDSSNPHNYTDIFARRFTIQGYATDESSLHFYADGGADGAPLANVDPYLADVDSVKAVQCVRPLAEQFCVNVETNGTQALPSVSCDTEGNFAVSWTSDSQWNSYFSGVVAAWFDSTGLGITGDVVVAESDPTSGYLGTPAYGESYVKMGPDGTTVIAWTNYENLYKSVYGAGQYRPFVDSVQVAAQAYSPSIDFDNNGHYVIAWTAANGSFVENLANRAYSTVMAELFYVTSDENQNYTEVSMGSGDVGSTEGAGHGETLYVLNVGNMSVGMDADGDLFFAYQGFGYDVQAIDDTLKVGIGNKFAQSNYVDLPWEEIEEILKRTGNEDLKPYFEAWFGNGSFSADSNYYSYYYYLNGVPKAVYDDDVTYTVYDSVGTAYGFVDPDDYIKAALSSIERQIKEKLYEESYKDYFANELDIITKLYEKWNAKYDEFRAEIEKEWSVRYYPYVQNLTYDDFLTDTTLVKDPNTVYYGMTYGELALYLTDKSNGPYLNVFVNVLRDALTEYYYGEGYDALYRIWYETLCHIYSEPELSIKVDEKVREVISESIDRSLAAFNDYIRENDVTPDEALLVLFNNGVISGIDSNAVIATAEVKIKEWVTAYLIELKVNDYLYENSDQIHMQVLERIDENVKSDLTSTYKERYDSLVEEKIDAVRNELNSMTYADFAASSKTIDDPASDYFGKTYAEVTQELDDEEAAYWPRPGDPEYDDKLEEIRDEYSEMFYDEFYEYYWELLRPEYTVDDVVDYVALADAADAAAKLYVDEYAGEVTAKWAFWELLVSKNREAIEERDAETGEVTDYFRSLSDTQLREMYRVLITPDYTDADGYVDLKGLNKEVNLAPVLKMIAMLKADYIDSQAVLLAQADLEKAVKEHLIATEYDALYAEYKPIVIEALTAELTSYYRGLGDTALRSLYSDYLKPQYTDADGKVNQTDLARAVALATTSEMIAALIPGNEAVAQRTDEKVNSALNAEMIEILTKLAKNSPSVEDADFYDDAAVWVIQERVRERMIEEVAVDETLFDQYYEKELEATLELYHTGEIRDYFNEKDPNYGAGDQTRLEGLFNQYYQYLTTTKKASLTRTYTTDVRNLLTNLSYYPEEYYATFNAMKDVDLERLYAELVRPYFSGSAGNVDQDALDAAVRAAGRFEIIWTLVYNEMVTGFDDDVVTVMRNELRSEMERDPNYARDKENLLDEYQTRYYDKYIVMDFNELTERYRKELVLKFAADADLEAAMAEVAADTPENRAVMAEVLGKADLAADYRALLYARQSSDVDEINSATDRKLQEFAEIFVADYEAYYAMNYQDLLQALKNYYIEMGLSESQAEEIITYYENETDYNRIVISVDLAYSDAEKATKYDANKAMSFCNTFYASVRSGSTPEEASETAMDYVLDVYSEALYVSVDLLGLNYDVESATLDEMIDALSDHRLDLKYDGIVQEELNATVSNMIYNAIYHFTGETFLMEDFSLMNGTTSEIKVEVDIPETFESLFTKWVRWNAEYQKAAEIRAEYGTDWFKELRPAVESAKHDEYYEDLKPQFTDDKGKVDEWSLEEAVQKKIDQQTKIEVDERIAEEAKEAVPDAAVKAAVEDYMKPETDILGQSVTINYDEINASVKKIVPILVDATTTVEAWKLVEDELARLVNLRVTHDMAVWNDASSTAIEREEILRHANSVLTGGETVASKAQKDIEDLYGYADDEIHDEVQSSIVYDGIYSTYYNRYNDSLYASNGKALSYLDILSNDADTFAANEFSPYYGMTYGDICQYLTEEYRKEYPELSQAELETKVKDDMLRLIIVPDQLHAQTMELVDYAQSLVMYADVYEEMYDKYADSVRDEIYEELYDELYAEVHDALYNLYYDSVREELYDTILTTYPRLVLTGVKEAYAEELGEALAEATEKYDRESVRNAYRNTLDGDALYNSAWEAKKTELLKEFPPEEVTDQFVTENLAEDITGDAKSSKEDVTTKILDNEVDVYIDGLINKEIAPLLALYTKPYIEKVIDDANSGIQPSWIPQGESIPRLDDLIDAKIATFINDLIAEKAAQKVVESGRIDEYTRAEIDKIIEDKIYELIDKDPKYIAQKADIMGRANAVMEYNLQYLRGEGNGIYFTTYNAGFEATDGGSAYSNGIVNAQRDGNNQKYYIGIPKTSVSGGTLTVEVLWEGNEGDTEELSVSFSLVVEENVVKLNDTIEAIVNAFTNAAGQYADWKDGMFDSVFVTNVTDTQTLYEGTSWDWDNYRNLIGGGSVADQISNSYYWSDDYHILEMTFQGGAHDSEIQLYFDSDNSSLSYAVDNDYFTVLTALKDNGALKINDIDYETAAYIHDLIATRVSGSVYYDDCMAALQVLYSGLDHESVLGKLVNELFSGSKTLTTSVYNILQRCTNQIDYDYYDFFNEIDGLLEDQIVREGNSPILYSILKYVTNNGSASTTLNDLYALFRHFYVPRQLDQDPISHSTVTTYDAEGKPTVNWEGDNWLAGEVDAAHSHQDEILNPEDDVIKYEFILAKSLTGSRGKRQINASVGMNDSGNVVVVWQQQKTVPRFTLSTDSTGTISSDYDDDSISYYGDSVVQAGKLSIQTQCTQIYLRSFVESTDYAGARVTSVLLPDGEQVKDGDTVTSGTKNLVVTFTENLQSTNAGYNKLHAVDNPDNWMILKDGVLIQNAIEKITFSMNASRFEAEDSEDERINGGDNNPDSLKYGSNQYEAVITFKDGRELTEGSYTLVATNMIHDIAGNAINSNGNSVDKNGLETGRDGYNYEMSFTVVPLDEPLAFGEKENENFGSWSRETKIDDAVGENTAQWTTERLLDDVGNYRANSPNSVASDASGNFVAVWTQTTKNDRGETVSGGIYYKVYREEYIIDASGVRQAKEISTTESQALYFELVGDTYYYYADATKASQVKAGKASDGYGIKKADFTVPRQASVAMDDAGNFVIVWDMLAMDDQLGHDVSRDVYVRRYALSGRELGVNGYLLPYRVNIETEFDQQNASVAMDADGDFVIVWESWDQDGSGWGIYGRRFDDDALSFGRSNTIDLLTLTGTFAPNGHYMNLAVTGLDGIEYNVNGIVLSEAVNKTCDNIRTALKTVRDAAGNYVFWDDATGEEFISVTRHGVDSINFEFAGSDYAYREVADIRGVIYDAPYLGAKSGGTVSASLRANVAVYALGKNGTEFEVNETTVGDQRFASIGMNSEGTFVVSWTSWGQDKDAATESNIYARRFVSNHSLVSKSVTTVTPTASGASPTVASIDPVRNHIADSAREYTGVAYIGIGSADLASAPSSGTTDGEGGTDVTYGSGELLSTGYHVMTAAHMVYDEASGGSIDPSTVYVSFVNTAGDIYTYVAKEIYVYTDYAGDYLGETDLAIIVLSDCVDSSIARYDIYRDRDELDKNFTMAGFGTASQVGYRETAEDDTAGDGGAAVTETVVSKHFGMNTFELYGSDVSGGYNYNTLLWDFDDGSKKRDTFGNNYGVVHRGLGDDETMAALGDSGGACFIDGKVAGVISWSNSATPGEPVYGDYAAAVRVSAYADWIDMICAGVSSEEFLVNTMSTLFTSKTTTTEEDGSTTTTTTTTETVAVEVLNDEYQKGMQLWSDVAVDDDENFVITWTSYNQDGYGDTASGGSSNGLAGVYMRRYHVDTAYANATVAADDDQTAATASSTVTHYYPGSTAVKTEYVSDVTLVNEYTGYDQANSKIDMDGEGNYVITWVSYQNRVFGSDVPIADGIFARQYLNCSEYYAALGDYYGVTDEDADNAGENDAAGTNTATSGNAALANGDDDETGVIGTNDAGTNNAGTTDTGTNGAGAGGAGADGSGTADPEGENGAAGTIYATGNFALINSWTADTFAVSETMTRGNVDVKTGSIGGAFKVNALTSADLNGSILDNQRGAGVAVNANGDMVFVWTDMNDLSTPDKWDARVVYRTVTKSTEDVPPFVTTAVAAYGDPGTAAGDYSNVSLIGETVTFKADHGPSAVVYTFSELMYARNFILQLYDDAELDAKDYPDSEHLTTLYSSNDTLTRSVLNRANWTMLRNNIAVTSSEIETIYYGYNAGFQLGYSVNRSEQYELVIVFTDQLDEGVYTITLKDSVTDLAKNKLDGNYDGKAGGSFTVRFNVGVNGVPSTRPPADDKDDPAYTDESTNHQDPEIVTFADGSFIIVSETYTETEEENDETAQTGTETAVEDGNVSDIVIRKFNASGEPDSGEIIANVYTAGIQEDPDIAGYDYENYVVVWTGEGEDGDGVYARFYNSGAKKTEEIRVNDIHLNMSNKRTYSAQVVYDETVDAYLLTWRQQQGANYLIHGKYYSLTGNELSQQFVVASPTYASIDHYHISCQNGYYGLAWSEYTLNTNTTEVFASTFAKSAGSWSINRSVGSGGSFRVNQTTSGSQYEVRTALDNRGKFYAVWTSTQNLGSTDWDIYTRSFSFRGNAAVGETKVNSIHKTDLIDTRQCEPCISVDEDGAGYVITWSSKNTEGINFDTDLREQLYDYGIMACAFNADGRAIDAETGALSTTYDATFVVNRIINGNQMNSVVSVYGWDNGIPRFVVAWDGPMKVDDAEDGDAAGDETDEGGEGGTTPIAAGDDTTGTDGEETDLGYTEYQMVYYRTIPRRSSATTIDVEKALSSDSNATDLLVRDRLADSASGAAGYYRPSNHEMEIVNPIYPTIQTDALEIAGTAGDDILTVTADSAGTAWTVRLNGTVVAAGVTNRVIRFNGAAGSDRIVFEGSAKAENAVINGASGTARIEGAGSVLNASSIESFEINAGGGADALTVYTSAANDRVTLGIGEMTLTSSGRFAVSASGFEEIAARSSGGSDTVVLLDSDGDDVLSARNGYVKFTGGGVVNEAFGFENVRAVAENGGADSALFESVTNLVATYGQVIGKTSASLTTAIGFGTVTAVGGTGSSATLVGSKKADVLTGDADGAVLTYNDGRTVSVTGFRSIDTIGNGGRDSAVLTGGTGVNAFIGRSGSASLTNGSFLRGLSGFSRIDVLRLAGSVTSTYKATLYDSVMDDMITEEGENVAVDFGGHEVYNLIAFDQVTAKKEMNEGNDVVVSDQGAETVIFSSGWDFQN